MLKLSGLSVKQLLEAVGYVNRHKIEATLVWKGAKFSPAEVCPLESAQHPAEFTAYP